MKFERSDMRMLEDVLDFEMQKFLHNSFDEWMKMKFPINYGVMTASGEIDFAIQLIEKKPKYVHIAFSTYDGKPAKYLFGFIPIWSPCSKSVICYCDGKIEGPKAARLWGRR